MKRFKEFLYSYIGLVIITFALIFITVVLISFALNSKPEEITIVKDPAWLEWERAYGRQGF